MTELRNDFMVDSWAHFWQVKNVNYIFDQATIVMKKTVSPLKLHFIFPLSKLILTKLKNLFFWNSCHSCDSDIFLNNNCSGIICYSLRGTVRLIWFWHNFGGGLREPSLTGYKCDNKSCLLNICPDAFSQSKKLN